MICMLVLFTFVQTLLKTSSATVASIAVCEKERIEYDLKNTGYQSAVSVNFAPENVSRPCKLKVTAPDTHIVSVTFVTQPGDSSNVGNEMPGNYTSCDMNIFLPENRQTPVWTVDLCNEDVALLRTRLLTPQLKITWNPPVGLPPSFLSRTQMILTAVGKGEYCLKSGQHPCWRVGWSPIMCVSQELVCDGIQNCPREDSDESPSLCQGRSSQRTSWEIFAKQIVMRFTNQNAKGISINDLESNAWLQHSIASGGRTSTTPFSVLVKDDYHARIHASSVDALPESLKPYGMWGYLVLGMLISTIVLAFCGMYECCCQRHKPPQQARGPQPSLTHPTFLIINSAADTTACHSEPPSYDELDQPPSYALLFPAEKTAALSLLVNRLEEGLRPALANYPRNDSVESFHDGGSVVGEVSMSSVSTDVTVANEVRSSREEDSSANASASVTWNQPDDERKS